MNYLIWLAALSAVVIFFEWKWPTREQKQLRTWLWSDFVHLLFNGHFLGLMLYGISFYYVIPVVDDLLAARGWTEAFYFSAASGWHIAVQAVVALVALDFVQWLVHNTLHRSPFLWRIHQVHHSVKDGEMDWIVSFRFSWIEPAIYKAAMYLPAMWFGFAPEALFFHAVFGTLIGHLNHANLTWDYGPLRYVFNSPRMHLYHHDYEAPAHGQNFGITLSCWDWIFGTAHLPPEPPKKIGFPGVEHLPNDFFGQLIWPIPLALPTLRQTNLVASVAGVVVLAGLYGASLPPSVDTPMFGEASASSQPAAVDTSTQVFHAETPVEQEAALGRFGSAASEAGWASPETAVSALELAEALGSEQLVILDVRKKDRFELGHIPSSQLVTRRDYSGGPVPGVSLDIAGLQEMLQRFGVNRDSSVVILSDGGPEPYRLWWTLQQVGGFSARVLDGGLAGWKAIGERLAEGPGLVATAGNIQLEGGPGRNLMWPGLSELHSAQEGIQLLDTRNRAEYAGEETHRKAKKAGHIPGAQHLLWTAVLELDEYEVPRMQAPEAILTTVQGAGIDTTQPLVTYCQSGTRSSAVFYGLMQAGVSLDLLWNYDGSWAEYSRLDLPVQVSPNTASL